LRKRWETKAKGKELKGIFTINQKDKIVTSAGSNHTSGFIESAYR